MFLLFKEKNRGKHHNWNFWFGVVLVQKWPFRDRQLFLFLVCVLGVRAFWAKLLKKVFLDKNLTRKIRTDNWKALFWGEGSCFVSFISVHCFFCLFCFCFLGGCKGQVRWPCDLALNPPYLFWVCLVLFYFLFLFPFWRQRELFSPLKKGIFCLFFSASFCFSLAFFPSPFFHSLSLSLSISLSLSLSCSLLSFFLPSFLFFLLSLASLFCLFVSLPCFFAFVSWE